MAGFALGSPLNTPYYEGGGSTTLAPFVTDVALGGHPYMINWKSEVPLRHVSIPILRQQQDTSDSPGEQSINAEGLWRRFGESWHMGAGQERYDRKESNPFRFRTSLGVNVWNKWELSLLHDVELYDGDSASNQRMAVAGGFLYYAQGAALRYTSDLTALPTTVTGLPATNTLSITSNGNRVWTAHGNDGVYMTVRNTPTTALHITGPVNIIAYVKNRVMAAHGANIYDVTSIAVGAAAALPPALFTHGNTDWNWVGFAESQGFIYAAGFSGDKSLIYSLGITTDGTALAQPVVAGPLPDGEIVTGLYGYLGRFLALGTNKGFRLALVSSDGGLNIGALVTTPTSVLCFEGQEEWLWFGYSNYSPVNTGLGRFSTNKLSDPDNLVPAYASDLMVTGSGDITDICTFDDRRVFAVSGVGLYVESEDELVESGFLDTGGISYGITEPKTALFVDLQVEDNGTTDSMIEVMFSTDGSTFNSLSVFNSLAPIAMAVGESVGNEFEIRLRISRDTVNTSLSASILSWLLRVQPRPLVTNMILATIILAPEIEPLAGDAIPMDSAAELDYIEKVNASKEVVTFQHNKRLYSVIVDDYEINLHSLIESVEGMTGFNADCTLKLKRV